VAGLTDRVRRSVASIGEIDATLRLACEMEFGAHRWADMFLRGPVPCAREVAQALRSRVGRRGRRRR
jgi:hypothetical protein